MGVLCSSTDKDFLTDIGVSKLSDADSPSGIAHATATYRVATGTSLYPMKPSAMNGVAIHTADVDCDEANGESYRPTATCSITVSFLKDGRFFYGRFVLRDHAKGIGRADIKDVRVIWNNLTLSISTLGKH